MIEQAKEELQILEAQHPNGFDYLKLELKSFIFLLESQNPPANSISLPASSTATTQVSSTSRKRKKCCYEVQRTMEEGAEEYCKKKLQRSSGRRRPRIDVVIKRAQACLHKIQKLKTSFLIS